MLDMTKYKDSRGKIQLPTFIVRNMQNYVKLLGHRYFEYYANNAVLNIYLPNQTVVTYYSTKNYANLYVRRKVTCKIYGWLNVLRYLSTTRGL